MFHMIVYFVLLTLVIALVSGAWSYSNKEERVFILKALFKGAVFAFIALVILFVVVNLF